jgi:hypothetical protein
VKMYNHIKTCLYYFLGIIGALFFIEGATENKGVTFIAGVILIIISVAREMLDIIEKGEL